MVRIANLSEQNSRDLCAGEGAVTIHQFVSDAYLKRRHTPTAIMPFSCSLSWTGSDVVSVGMKNVVFYCGIPGVEKFVPRSTRHKHQS